MRRPLNSDHGTSVAIKKSPVDKLALALDRQPKPKRARALFFTQLTQYGRFVTNAASVCNVGHVGESFVIAGSPVWRATSLSLAVARPHQRM